MGSNTHENLALARHEIELALILEREGSGASNDIIQRIVRARQLLHIAQEVQQAILAHREPRQILVPQRTLDEIAESGAAWITERELAWIVDELRRYQSGSEIPALRQMVTDQAETIRQLEAERGN